MGYEGVGYDAVILAGGRSSRLGGRPKAELAVAGRTLLETTLDAVADAQHVVVVGGRIPEGSRALGAREDPPFSGPAAAIAAGIDALESAAGRGDPSGIVVVLACDMPRVASVVPLLLDAAGSGAADGVLAVDGGRIQYLAGAFRRAALRRAADPLTPGALEGLSVKRLIGGLNTRTVAVPEGATHDVDTWSDAIFLGIDASDPGLRGGFRMTANGADDADEGAVLRHWAHALAAELALEGVEVDVDGVLSLAGAASRAVIRPAAPLTTFIAGYRAGLAAAAGDEPAAAIDGALRQSREFAASWAARPGNRTD
jgi:molybdopterin-guanine dinucleotide biosynthesis protein A